VCYLVELEAVTPRAVPEMDATGRLAGVADRRVDKILKRSKQTAKALGITYPLSLLANEVIE